MKINGRISDVIKYFDENWANSTYQWVRYHLTNYHMYGNETNNRTESLNQKFKAIIAKYSSLPVFFNELMSCVASIRIEHDIHAAEILNRQRVNTEFESHDKRYYSLLTEYAFDLYYEESTKQRDIQFTEIDDRIGLIVSNQCQGMLVTANTCNCSFFKSMHLPCRHILAFRRLNEQRSYLNQLFVAIDGLSHECISLHKLATYLTTHPTLKLLKHKMRCATDKNVQ